ncbi:hypothetical protein HB364_22215 [Pseudoflavitalea sp. X16]|uniref:nitrous oxide reductase accessory protein NosL n=1 Tax=Paraflavitalea devenefica TaxID=2716334 RepID=UPI00142411CF|nr:nitrous oxide reductase accessory protein NosL [Paraflavitalea devenefica]NII27814.1 hypothetical protein [Paraflavitalea devenefica]
MQKLSILSRILVAFAAGALVAVFFLPAWRIDLFAPQYPEGLTMRIWINGLSGDVDVINGLNHYIGMKHISADMFPEFTFLPYVVGFFMLLGITIAVSGSRKLLLGYLVLSAIGAALAIFDFYQWGYDYGHDLDPKAPIQVPGLSYQPPLFGHKRLLNFDAYSFPDVAGWIVIAASALAFAVWLAEWYHARKKVPATVLKGSPAILLLLCWLLPACQAKPQPFTAGKDVCDFCRMGISDLRFGGELLTTKGKVYKFDDLHCVAAFLRSGKVTGTDIDQLLVINYEKQNTFLNNRQASFVISSTINSPMDSHTAAFESSQAASAFCEGKEAAILTWPSLIEKLQ